MVHRERPPLTAAGGRADPKEGATTSERRPDNVHTAALASFAAGLRIGDLPPEVCEHAKWDILDTLGCALHGQTLPIAGVLRQGLRPLSAGGDVPIWGDAWTAAPDVAALVNATLADSFELDDLHARAVIHPGAVTLAAVLALGRLSGATGADAVTAHVAGLEVGTRVGVVIGATMLRRGWHSHSVLAPLAAAAGAARTLRLDAPRALHAIGIAGSLAGGLMAAQYGAMVKRLHSGHASQTGVRAALLAAAGFTGIEALLEEPYGGFLANFGGGSEPGGVSADLGRHWEMLQVGFKPYAACGSSHTTIDVLLDLRRRFALDAARVRRVRIGCSTTTKEHVGWAYRPGGATAAQMNLPYAAAVALVDGRVSVEQFDEDHLARPDILAVSDRVEVVADQEIDARGREHRHEVAVRVELDDGRAFEGGAVHARGSADRPMTPAERREKFFSLASRRLRGTDVERLYDLVMSLDRAPDLAPLEALLRFGPVPS